MVAIAHHQRNGTHPLRMRCLPRIFLASLNFRVCEPLMSMARKWVVFGFLAMRLKRSVENESDIA